MDIWSATEKAKKKLAYPEKCIENASLLVQHFSMSVQNHTNLSLKFF